MAPFYFLIAPLALASCEFVLRAPMGSTDANRCSPQTSYPIKAIHTIGNNKTLSLVNRE